MLLVHDTLVIQDPEVVRAALDGVSAVSHHAAMVGLGVDLDDVVDYIDACAQRFVMFGIERVPDELQAQALDREGVAAQHVAG